VNPEELHSLAEADSVELHMVAELHMVVEPDSLVDSSSETSNIHKFRLIKINVILHVRDGPLFFWRGGGMDISSTQTIFFGVVVVANNFFVPASFCKQFFLSI
jgi:hypothetical protein